MSGFSGKPVREILTAARTYYVRTDGSDSNTGLVNTSGEAFLTIQKAINTACALDLSTFGVTIQVGAGTYTAALTLKSYVGVGPITLQGDTSTPSNVILDVANYAITASNNFVRWVVQGFKFTSSSNIACVYATGFAAIDLTSCDFGACTGGVHMNANNGGAITITGNYSISGGTFAHYLCNDRGTLTCIGRTITLTGTPAFTDFALCARLAELVNYSCTFSGSATGIRYAVDNNAVILTNGGGANYFPGNSAGSAATGGLYS